MRLYHTVKSLKTREMGNKGNVTINLISILIGAGAMFLILYFGKCSPGGTNVFPTHTDTVIRDSFIFVKIKGDTVKPQIIERYFYGTRVDSFISFEVRKDTLYLLRSDSTLFTFNKKFLYNYPDNPKLIQQILKKGNQTLSMMDPKSGDVTTYNYPLDLDNYDYAWQFGKFLATKKTLSNKVFGQIKPEVYIGAYYNPFRNTIRLEAEGTIKFKKFSLSIRPTFEDTKQQKFGVYVGGKYQIH